MVELDIPHDTKMWVEVSYIAKLQADYKLGEKLQIERSLKRDYKESDIRERRYK